MKQLSIEICNNRVEAEARKLIVKSANPSANWQSRIIEKVGVVLGYLVPDIAKDPEPQIPPVFSPETRAPAAPCVVLLIWVED